MDNRGTPDDYEFDSVASSVRRFWIGVSRWSFIAGAGSALGLFAFIAIIAAWAA